MIMPDVQNDTGKVSNMLLLLDACCRQCHV